MYESTLKGSNLSGFKDDFFEIRLFTLRGRASRKYRDDVVVIL